MTAYVGPACIENGEHVEGQRTAHLTLEAFIAGHDQAPRASTFDVSVDCTAVKLANGRAIPR